MSETPAHPPVGANGAGSTVQFAMAARTLAAAARRSQLVAPSFRTPPRLVGLDRTIRRHREGGVVAVRLRNRPWAAVLADMIDGVVAVNTLTGPRAGRTRADLWDAIMQLDPPMPAGADTTAGHPRPRVA